MEESSIVGSPYGFIGIGDHPAMPRYAKAIWGLWALEKLPCRLWYTGKWFCSCEIANHLRWPCSHGEYDFEPIWSMFTKFWNILGLTLHWLSRLHKLKHPEMQQHPQIRKGHAYSLLRVEEAPPIATYRYMFFVVKSLHSAAERCWLKRWWCFCVCQPRRLMDIDWFSCGILGASWYEVMDKRPAHPAWPGMAAVSALHHVAAKVALNGRANGATEPQRWRLQRLRCRGRHFIWNVVY